MVKVLKLSIWIVLVITGALVLLVGWALIEPYFIATEEQNVEISGLPASWEGERIGVVADWQIGMWLDNTPTVRRSVERLVEERPAAVLLAGDFIYGPSQEWDEDLRKVQRFTSPLAEADIPTYAVLGNHDYRMAKPDGTPNPQAAQRVRAALRDAGVRVLKNEAVALDPPADDAQGQPSDSAPQERRLHLAGIGASWPGEARPAKALAGVPAGAPRLVVMHNPNAFGPIASGRAPLAVAGHTHGGQVSVPGTPKWTWMTYAKKDKVHADGWIQGYGSPENRLYVNRGIGFSLAPIRFSSRPEVTFFTLSDTQD